MPRGIERGNERRRAFTRVRAERVFGQVEEAVEIGIDDRVGEAGGDLGSGEVRGLP